MIPSSKPMDTSEPLDSPAFDAAVVTPSDTVEIQWTRALYVGGTGNVNVQMVSGRTALFSAVPVGTILPLAVKKVLATNTTATLIVAMY